MNTQNNTVNILFIGDIVGRGGRKTVKSAISQLKKEINLDLIIANAENAASGFGITLSVYKELLSFGIDICTSGNHIYDKREIIDHLDKLERLIRPANLPSKAPGKGFVVVEKKGVKFLIVNLLGRVFMPLSDCPFQTYEKILMEYSDCLIIVDFHGEATSEKSAFAYNFDGKALAVIGSHTHVQTNDDRLLPKGTFYMTDVGMCGALDSCIGVLKENSIEKFLTSMPVKFDVEKKGKMLFNAVFFSVDIHTKKVIKFEKIYKVYGD